MIVFVLPRYKVPVARFTDPTNPTSTWLSAAVKVPRPDMSSVARCEPPLFKVPCRTIRSALGLLIASVPPGPVMVENTIWAVPLSVSVPTMSPLAPATESVLPAAIMVVWLPLLFPYCREAMVLPKPASTRLLIFETARPVAPVL